jgi:hypothetical protein
MGKFVAAPVIMIWHTISQDYSSLTDVLFYLILNKVC